MPRGFHGEVRGFFLHFDELEMIVEIARLAPILALPGPPFNFSSREPDGLFPALNHQLSPAARPKTFLQANVRAGEKPTALRRVLRLTQSDIHSRSCARARSAPPLDGSGQ
jgi:hypothetical protein